MIPAPMPVPTARNTTSLRPRAAPSHCSASTQADRSLSITTGAGSRGSSSLLMGAWPPPQRFGAQASPLSSKYMPGTHTPAPATASRLTEASASAASASSATCAAVAAGPGFSAAALRFARIAPSRFTTPTAVLVPPRSAASTTRTDSILVPYYRTSTRK